MTTPLTAASLAVRSRHAASRVAEILLLVEAGESLHSIAARLGVRPESVLRRLHRHGHHRVAAKIRNRKA